MRRGIIQRRFQKTGKARPDNAAAAARGKPGLRQTSLLIFALLFSLVIPYAAAGEPPGALAFGALPLETGPALSTDGQKLAWIEHGNGQDRAIVFDLATRKTQRTFETPAATDLQGVRWQDDQTILLWAVSRTESRIRRLIAYDIAGGPGQEMLAPFSYLVAWRTSKPRTMIVATEGAGSAHSRLLEIDTHSGATNQIGYGTPHTIKWIVDRDGAPVAREEWEWTSHQYRIYANSAGSLREIFRRDDVRRPQVGGVLVDGRSLLLLATNGRAHQAAWALPLDGSPMQLLVEEPDADITDVVLDQYSEEVIGVFVGGGQGSIHWLDPIAKARYDSIARGFPGHSVEPYGWTKDGTKTLVRVSSASSPTVFYLWDLGSHRADIAAEEYPGLAKEALAEVKEITYKARDGTQIMAYLTRPAGLSGPAPLIVLPHGGPHLRDFPEFNLLTQFLATRGYLVVQPQFRGSTGFGDAFRDAGERQWGRLMQDDLTDAVKALVVQGLVDPHRVCIVGTSGYGGYAALAGAAYTPDQYACAVSINGISDLAFILNHALVPSAGPYRFISANQSVWKNELGSLRDAARVSPINSVSSIKSPILIMYGPNGETATAQSESMISALQHAGKDVKAVALPTYAWWWERAATRVQVMQELEQFLGDHLSTH